MKKTDHKMHPETHMTSLGYDPFLSEGAVKSPVFQTSTFAFKSAAEGKAFFELAYGLRDPQDGEQLGLIYSRLNNPNLQILEERLAVWDSADDCAVFESGMAAISTTLLEFLKPGDLFLFGNPVYGGTSYFINHILTQYGIHIINFTADNTKEEIIEIVEKTGLQDKLKAIYIETPGNPTNAIIDIEGTKEIAKHFSNKEYDIPLIVDNTFLGPVFQHPMDHGADLVVYSATKYIGGHSDIIAGVVSGKINFMTRVKGLRTFLGNMASPWTSWLLMRSLETLKIRMEKQSFNAQKIADHLVGHSKIEKVSYLGKLEEGTKQKETYDKQCLGPGGMLSFYVKGGEEQAFKFIDSLIIPKVAVSLGSTESLVEHPATMTHAEIPREEKQYLGITENLVRLSVGVENHKDLIWDIEQALDKI